MSALRSLKSRVKTCSLRVFNMHIVKKYDADFINDLMVFKNKKILKTCSNIGSMVDIRFDDPGHDMQGDCIWLQECFWYATDRRKIICTATSYRREIIKLCSSIETKVVDVVSFDRKKLILTIDFGDCAINAVPWANRNSTHWSICVDKCWWIFGSGKRLKKITK